uniref:Reverse transcriptase domain-containing protein n=1 Tax=Tanacetum cinerariifolium TaxID=118510 RepID=A0A6L2L7C5_TANCI|nr:hypothetical protein [Tanacetum cinerariifolium]
MKETAVDAKVAIQEMDRTVKYLKGIAENVLVGISKFVFPIEFIILDMPEDVKVPLILKRPFLSTDHAKIDVFKRKITLRVGDEKIIFKGMKPASSLINRVYISLDPLYGDYIELNALNVPLELRRNQVDDLIPTTEEVENMDGYRDQDIGYIILGESLCKASRMEARRCSWCRGPFNGGNCQRCTNESDKFIKSSVEDLVPIPSEFGDTSGSDSECDLPSCDNFSPINIFEGKYMTFSNPLFDLNDNFTFSDDESLSDEDVPKENVKAYSNPLLEFNDEYISSDVNPLFNEVLEDIENKDSYVSNLDEPAFLVTPLSDANENECFDPGGDIDEINTFLDIDTSTDIKDDYHDSESDVLYHESLLSDDTTPNLPSEVFLDHDPRSLSDINDLKITVKVFDLGISKKFFSPTYEARLFLSRVSYFVTCLWFCPSFTRASILSMFIYGNPIS